MDDLVLAVWLKYPNDMGAPPGAILADSPKGRSYLLSKKEEMDFDHAYSAPMSAAMSLECSKNCRYKTLIQCEYCPRQYHQYSLNPPPPIEFPNGRWMCPNHPQCLIECVASLPPLAAPELSARSSLTNTVMLGESSLRLTVGTDDTCEVSLNATLCSGVSKFHAAIYENKVTREYKLINYSEYGSTVAVDGIVFRLGTAQARGPTVKARTAVQVDPPVLLPSEHPCSCPPQGPILTHGPAMLIEHGCLLGFGCQMFKFCIES